MIDTTADRDRARAVARQDNRQAGRQQGSGRVAAGATVRRGGAASGAMAGRGGAASGATARRDATIGSGRTCAMARQGDSRAGRWQDGGGVAKRTLEIFFS